MDFIDNTVEREQMILNAQIRTTLDKNKMIRDAPSSPFCHYCDEPIPLARQQAIAGCMCCVDCQELIEKGKVF